MSNKNELLDNLKDEKIIVATSGGSDSMALLSMLLKRKYNISACYVNHKQRKIENEEEIALISDYCLNNDIPFYVSEINIKKGMKNAQAYFREERYRLLLEQAHENKATVIVTAHHFDDQIETQLMHMLKGYGIASIHGISQTRDEDGIRIVRPLIQYSKKELLEYCQNNGTPFLLDSSNLQNKYLRNHLRNIIIPEITATIPEVKGNLSDFFQQVTEMHAYILESFMESQLFQHVKKSMDEESFAQLFKAKSVGIQRLLLKQVLTSLFQYEQTVSSGQLDEILSFFNSKEQRKVALEKGCYLIKRNGKIALERENCKETTRLIQLNMGLNNLDSKSFYLSMNEHENKDDYFCLFAINQMDMLNGIFIRHPRPGDKIAIKGGHKKIARLYIDEKVPLQERQASCLFLTADNHVIFDSMTGRISDLYFKNQKESSDNKVYIYEYIKNQEKVE